MSLTLSGTNGVVGAGFTIDPSGINVAVGVVTATSYQGSAASLTQIPAANIVGVCTSGFTKTGGFGKILQVASAAKTDTTSTSTATYAAISGLQPSLTPSSSSNKILITVDLKLGFSNAAADVNLQLFRSVGGSETQIYLGDADGSRLRCFFGGQNSGYADSTAVIPVSATFLDSPNTTSAVTYLVKWGINRSSTYLYLNRSGDDTNNDVHPRTGSSITIMEIEA